MQQVVQGALSNLEQVVQKSEACVTHGELPTVTGDESQLTQLMQNLIGNGIKYCAAACPTVHITAGRIRRTLGYLP